MKIIKIAAALISMFILTACELHMTPSAPLYAGFKPETDSNYYKMKTQRLVNDLTRNVYQYEINRVAVIDMTDEEGRVPSLGEYLSDRVIEAITRRKIFRVAQKGEVREALLKLNLKPAFVYTRAQVQSIGEALNAQAIITGKIRDLGANLDAHLALVDVNTGEVISSTSEKLSRTRYAVEMLHRK